MNGVVKTIFGKSVLPVKLHRWSTIVVLAIDCCECQSNRPYELETDISNRTVQTYRIVLLSAVQHIEHSDRRHGDQTWSKGIVVKANGHVLAA